MNTSARRRRESPEIDFDAPERQAHANHAARLRRILLDQFGITPQVIAPTGDNKGFVRLTFEELETLMYDDEGEDPQDGDERE